MFFLSVFIYILQRPASPGFQVLVGHKDVLKNLDILGTQGTKNCPGSNSRVERVYESNSGDDLMTDSQDMFVFLKSIRIK